LSSHKSSRRSRGNRNEHPPRPSAPPVAWYARIAWVPVGITLVVILTALFSADPIRDAASLGTVGEARLSVSAGYIAIAPL
jgi:hypothetical protein